jgi:hypothetical protein
VNQDGRQKPGILIQAEEARGFKLFGVRDLDGMEHVATEIDLQLLGTRRPD